MELAENPEPPVNWEEYMERAMEEEIMDGLFLHAGSEKADYLPTYCERKRVVGNE